LNLQLDTGMRPFKLRLHSATGKQLECVEYELNIDGETFRGCTDEQGFLELELPVSATKGTLRVKKSSQQIIIGALEPLHTAKGMRGRRGKLGYVPGPVDGVFGPKTTRAIRAFQNNLGLKTDGIAGPRTRDALQRGYGC